jgi:uncharacterized membrane protein YheB (UPF0754 family)
MKKNKEQKKTGYSSEDENYFSRLGDILSTHLEFDDRDVSDSNMLSSKTPHIEKLKILKVLKPIPWLLGGLFLFSFLWDFSGVSATVFGLELQFEGILRIISVSGMIGFLTNWIAITMLFRPLKKRPLLGQGLIPAHKDRIAYRLSRAVSEDLINPDLIKQKISESKAIRKYRTLAIRHVQRVTAREDFRHDLKEWILSYIRSLIQDPEFRKKISAHLLSGLDEALEDKVLEKMALKTYSFFRGQTLQEFIEELLAKVPVSAERNIGFIEEYLDDLPKKIYQNSEKIDDLVTQALYKLINQLNVQTLVEENIQKYDEQKLELMIRNATNEQLKTIQYLGAVLGTIGGFVIWEPVWSLAVLTVIFGVIYLVDRQVFAQ